MAFAKKDECAEDGPKAGLRKTQWDSLFSSLLCSSEQHVRAQDKCIAELTRLDMGSAANLDPITRFKGHKDGTELQRVLRLNDMMDAKSEEVEAKSAQIEEVEEAIRRRQQQEGIEYEQAPSPLNPWVIGTKPGKEGPVRSTFEVGKAVGAERPVHRTAG
jgi:hypothetical protein